MSILPSSSRLRRTQRTLLAAGLITSLAAPAFAGIHTWDVREVFSNADGTIQYVELFDAGTGGNELNVGNGSLSSSLHSISWSNGAVAPPTNGKRYLIATAGFAALPGAPTPDVIIPPANVPFFNISGDTVTFASVDSMTFGAVPTNGTDALDDTTGVGANSPENYAGVTGTVDASGSPAAVPTLSPGVLGLGAAALISLGGLAIRRTSAHTVD